MPRISIGDCSLYYERQGVGFPVLFISGLGGFASFWQDQVAAFGKRFEVITFDHRGIGQSDPARLGYTVERIAADVTGLLDALRIRRAHVIGHSTGGAIAQVLAIEHPSHYRLMFMTPKPALRAADSLISRGNPEQDAYAFLRATVTEAMAASDSPSRGSTNMAARARTKPDTMPPRKSWATSTTQSPTPGSATVAPGAARIARVSNPLPRAPAVLLHDSARLPILHQAIQHRGY